MGRKCEVKFCNNAVDRTKSKSFYGFPRNLEVCRKWVEHCKNEELEKSFQDGGVAAIRLRKICSDHFLESDFVNTRQTSQRIRAFAHLFDAGQSWRNTTSRGTSGDGQVVLYVETDPETLLGTTGDDQVVLFDETNPEILHGTTGEERDVLAYGLVWGNTVIRDAMEEEDAGPSSRNATPLGTTGEDQVVLYVETDPEILLGITGDDQDVLYDETDPKIQLGTTGGERDVLTYGWVQGNTVLLRLGTTDDGLVRRDSVLPDEMDSLKAQLESALQDNHN